MSGGGHLVVGSIKFVEGVRTEVLQRLAEMIGGLEVAPSFRDRSSEEDCRAGGCGLECGTASPDKHRVEGIAAVTFRGRAFQTISIIMTTPDLVCTWQITL